MIRSKASETFRTRNAVSQQKARLNLTNSRFLVSLHHPETMLAKSHGRTEELVQVKIARLRFGGYW